MFILWELNCLASASVYAMHHSRSLTVSISCQCLFIAASHSKSGSVNTLQCSLFLLLFGELTLSLPDIFFKLCYRRVSFSFSFYPGIFIRATEVAIGSMIGSESIMSTSVANANGFEPGGRL